MLTDVVIANRNYTRLSVAENETVDEIALKVMKQDLRETYPVTDMSTRIVSGILFLAY